MKRIVTLLILSLSLLAVSACGKSADAPATPTQSSGSEPVTSAAAAQPANAKEGEGFIRIAQPVRTSDPDKIEVTEVFWYGCSHCFDFEPMVMAWAKKLPGDVVFQHSPAMWNELMVTHAQAFYAAKALGVLEQMHQPIFDAINLKKNRLDSPEAIEKLFMAHSDVKAEDFQNTFDSFGVTSQVKQADARARAYGIAGTPELIINGKYRVTGRSAGGKAAMLKVAEELIAKERAAM
ncbi:DSBA-like thioredoxin [Spongiibacter sp. IMCC21906]|uniref:thiol:disulfide interchange protein DsbA/DsbL n=1 Tax=Spongiibacter sp. IMCC21906 TaxID=1620392 RepID=UPI00062DF1F7|nr:thiol:disulfide interchange protein DsbA/DsbL [Spongiibacter sp. IMCC21906]AKH68191.1 DSBA-like thioredoxin [Spongiibacter sp. IMCC21906]